MMNEVERNVKAFIRQHNMIKRGDMVIAGVSGGADSVCLLFILSSLSEELGFRIRVCHVNHGIRGTQADEDEEYVKKLCGELGIPCHVFREDVELFAKKWKQSSEEAGRTVRRNAFSLLIREWGEAKIATAHHSGDHAETVLWNMARGTGLKGLCGIRPVEGNRIRPLLVLTRRETEGYLRSRGITWREDATNAENVYTRNRIRHNVLPVLEEQINPGVVRHLEELSRQAREVWEFLERFVDQAWNRCVSVEGDEGGPLSVDEDRLSKELPAVRDQLLRRCISYVLGKEQDIGAVHVQALSGLFQKQVGKRLDLPGGVSAVKVYGGVMIAVPEAGNDEEGVVILSGQEYAIGRKSEEKILNVPGTTVFYGVKKGSAKLKITCRFVSAPDPGQAKEFPEKGYTKWIDYDIIKHGLSVRTRQRGDYFTIDAAGSRQKLKSFFINEKIPVAQRGQMLLIADGDHIVWIPGRRMSRACYISAETKKILEISIVEE